jgi:hypothetical protein
MIMVTVIGILLILGVGFSLFLFVFVNNKGGSDIDVLEDVRNPLVFQILVPRENDKTPLAAEQMFCLYSWDIG